MSVCRRRTPTPLVSELEASNMRSVTKTASLCVTLEEAHANTWKATTAPAPPSACFSKKLKEAILFSSTGSWFVDSLTVPTVASERFTEKLKRKNYVDRYIDSWTRSGSPTLWHSSKWRERVTSASRSHHSFI